MTTPSVAVIILSYNGKQLTLDCIASCLEGDYPEQTLVVVDNHSQDGSAEAVRAGFDEEIKRKKIVLIQNDTNLGFAGGNNVGIKWAFDQKMDFVFLLNNDTVVDRSCVSNLVAAFDEDPTTGMAGPKIYYFEPKDRIWFAGGEIRLARGVSRHIGIRETDRGQFDTSGYCDYITGCAMMIRRSAIESVGFLDTAYPMYSEDADYCFRAKAKGFRIRYEPRGKVWHKISAATGGQLNWKKIRLRLYSNGIFLLRYARWYHWLTIPFFFAIDGIRILLNIMTGKIKN